MNKKVAFKTLGCKVNQYETGSIKKSFEKNGYQLTDFNSKADLYIINTCAVTGEAERKSKQMIRKASRTNPSAKIIVTGCCVESNLKEIKNINNPNLAIIGNYYKEDIFSILKNTGMKKDQNEIYVKPITSLREYKNNPYNSITENVRALMKIQDGCNQFCSYCIIPYLRGKARSRLPEDIIKEIKQLSLENYQEIVLLGINLGSYGDDLLNQKINLSKIIKNIEKSTPISRIRLSSIELPWVTNELIETLSDSQKCCHHLHIPLQSGDDNILSIMNRKYNGSHFLEKVKTLQKNIPDISITTDVIVGFPGEDDSAFLNTYELIKKIGFAKIHIFPYSTRNKSLSAYLPDKIPSCSVVKERIKKLNKLAKDLTINFLQKNIGKEKNILIESINVQKNESYGLTDNYIRVCLNDINLIKGQLKKVVLEDIKNNQFSGRII
ncbi:MAG: tRNA (N(6)-L-threonylcarbamoyladenosine(37)-C(2))-methylthiotransferase MtaB [Atribacterota bacterium]|nr:tRNA (N(6)-L-threonylcarbamoyladenosine(37)-C(2))-methylthiotransferase MtaB [Atribacterota bacterium]